MHLGDIVPPEAVVVSLKVKNKKQLLTELSARAAPMSGLPEREIFDVLLHIASVFLGIGGHIFQTFLLGKLARAVCVTA